MRVLLSGCLVALCLVACGDDTSEPDLGGSVGAIHPLGYTTVRAQLANSSVSIEYRDREGTLVAVTFKTEAVKGPGTYPIPDQANVIMNRYSNPSADLVPTQGQLVLEQFEAKANANISGRFEAAVVKDDGLSNDNKTVKSYAVRGIFSTTLTDAKN